jgi:hypothetical protein
MDRAVQERVAEIERMRGDGSGHDSRFVALACGA